ncbi:MAG TPA: hypothetical protein VM888_05920, partial [Chitinophagaceae bacterium]|nr:hypothetical protein [Chitinophagaceae bacterium]
MKKIITLLVSFGAFTTLFAQDTRDMEEAKRVILGAPRKTTSPTQNPKDVVLGGDRRVYDESGRRYPDTYPNGSSRDAEINNINREYDAKIYSIRNNRYLSAAEKERTIRQLEMDRARAIKQVNSGYDRRYENDRNYKYNKGKKNKGNNGNHYGWEKG